MKEFLLILLLIFIAIALMMLAGDFLSTRVPGDWLMVAFVLFVLIGATCFIGAMMGAQRHHEDVMRKIDGRNP